MKKPILFLAWTLFCAGCLFSQNSALRNGTVLEEKSEGGHSYLIRHYAQTVTIGYAAEAYQLIVYDAPGSKNGIGNLERKDRIHITEMHIIDSKDVWLKIVSKKASGFILLFDGFDDIYKEGLWMPADTIKSGDKIWHTVKCNEGFFIYTNLNIRDKPGLAGNKIGMVKADGIRQYFAQVFELTEETETIDDKTDHWAKIEYNGTTGWVFGAYLTMERGGPKYHKPETLISLGLEQSP